MAHDGTTENSSMMMHDVVRRSASCPTTSTAAAGGVDAQGQGQEAVHIRTMGLWKGLRSKNVVLGDLAHTARVLGAPPLALALLEAPPTRVTRHREPIPKLKMIV